jgi:uncharacterized membrane protein YcaP (DUF421 family)
MALKLKTERQRLFMEWNLVFGSGEDLSALQMGFRAFLMFFITLILIRAAGMRIFGQQTAFDSILVIMLGAVLARAVVGASPFLSTVAAATVMVAIHKALAILAMKYTWIGKIVKGIHRSLYKDAQMNEKNMRQVSISKDDLLESVRRMINKDTFDEVKEIKIEKNGQLTVIQ